MEERSPLKEAIDYRMLSRVKLGWRLPSFEVKTVRTLRKEDQDPLF